MAPATRPPGAEAPFTAPPAAPPEAPTKPDAESLDKQNRRLDEELAETFPASDPVPVRHDS